MDRFSKMRLLVFSLFLSVSLPVLSAAPPAGSQQNGVASPTVYGPPPFSLDDPARIAAGKARFEANCAAYCHGHEGDGGITPAFKGRKDLGPAAAFKTITEGRRGAEVMPAWGQSHGFSAEERWELVSYIMYLTRLPAAK